VKVDPRILRQIAPPTFEPRPAPGPPEPERVVKNLPNAPIPKTQPEETLPQPSLPVPKTDAPKAVAKLESPDLPQPQHGLKLPNIYSGHSTQDLARDAARSGGPREIGGDVPVPTNPGGGGHSTAGAGMQVLTPLQGVDFTNYFARMYTTVRRNWIAVYPESAELGERGIVSLQFKVMRDGTVPAGEPIVVRSSGKPALDRAAVSSVRASSPFQNLPSAFSGDYVEFIYTYYYNVPYEPVR
jgi:TonB family protein